MTTTPNQTSAPPERFRPAVKPFRIGREFAYGSLWVAIGLLSGFLAKFVDAASHSGLLGWLLRFASDLTGGFGLWILLAVLIAIYSQRPWSAAIITSLFFIAMLLTYYLYTVVVLHFLFGNIVRGWMQFALLSSIAGFATWYAKHDGWVGMVLAALPVGFLLAHALPAYSPYKLVYLLDLLFAASLLFILKGEDRGRLVTALIAVVVAVLLTVSSFFTIVFSPLM